MNAISLLFLQGKVQQKSLFVFATKIAKKSD